MEENALTVFGPTSVSCGPTSHSFPHVSCGHSHVLALTPSGELHSWGSGTYGQLGHGDDAHQVGPHRVGDTSQQRYTAIAAGWRHSAAIHADGSLWTWGWYETTNQEELGKGHA
jgi:alpha-tubulin suppressor-like RCC1 family protein